MFAISHMISPAGAAAHTARPNTNMVLSITERTITLPTCGGRYGGSSRVKEEGRPLSSVADSRRDTAKVMIIPSTITPVSRRAEVIDAFNPPDADTKNMDIMAIRVGKRPLQGTKLLVMIAMSRSRGESIMRQPVTPTALHPNPMHMGAEKMNANYIKYNWEHGLV